MGKYILKHKLITNTIDSKIILHILWRTKLHWSFSSISKDGSDIHRFSNRKWVSTVGNVENLGISEAFLSKLEQFKHSLALPNIKCNCAILFWSQLYWAFIYVSKNIFPKKKNAHRCPYKNLNRNYCYRKKLLKFLQNV